MTTPISEVLRKARAVEEQGWTQGAIARNVDAEMVDPDDDDAVCWCAMGALIVAEPNFDRLLDALYVLRSSTNGYVDLFNDAPGRTQQEVIAAFDRAIAAEESK